MTIVEVGGISIGMIFGLIALDLLGCIKTNEQQTLAGFIFFVALLMMAGVLVRWLYWVVRN